MNKLTNNTFTNIPRDRCEDNIKRDVKELGWDGLD